MRKTLAQNHPSVLVGGWIATGLAVGRGGVLRGIATTLAVWHARRGERAALARLDDHLLADIGLTRTDAAEEAEKPFWRA